MQIHCGVWLDPRNLEITAVTLPGEVAVLYVDSKFRV